MSECINKSVFRNGLKLQTHLFILKTITLNLTVLQKLKSTEIYLLPLVALSWYVLSNDKYKNNNKIINQSNLTIETKFCLTQAP